MDWCGIITKVPRSWAVEVCIVCHLANGSEGRVHRAGRYITINSTRDFCRGRVCQAVGVKDRKAGVRIRGPTMNRKGKISNNINIYF